jgi:hypothetical protein
MHRPPPVALAAVLGGEVDDDDGAVAADVPDVVTEAGAVAALPFRVVGLVPGWVLEPQAQTSTTHSGTTALHRPTGEPCVRPRALLPGDRVFIARFIQPPPGREPPQDDAA